MKRQEDHTRKYDYKELGIALLVVVVLGLTAAIAFILLKQQSNSNLLHEVKQSNKILVDCTTPGHDCYKRSEDGTKKAILQLNTYEKAIVIAAAHCASIGNKSVTSITICVNKTLK